MIRIKQAVVVEGKYDKIKLSSLLDTVIITTDGFQIFKEKDRMAFIRRIAAERGIVILTDSDSAGFLIRSYLGGNLPKEQVIHAYIPDLPGKEKRKEKPSKEGKLGVEGVSTDVIRTALERAGVLCETSASSQRQITPTDLYEDGLSGTEHSAQRRRDLLRLLELPERLSTSALIDVLNMLYTYEQYQEIIRSMKKDLPCGWHS